MKNINEVLSHYRPSLGEIAARLNNDYLVPPGAIHNSYNPWEDDGANYYVQRDGVMYLIIELFGSAMSVRDNGCSAIFSNGQTRFFAQGISGIVSGLDAEGNIATVRRDAIGMSDGEPYKAYAGSQTVAEKRMMMTFGNAGGLFLARANRDKSGKFDLQRYRTEFRAAQERQNKPQALHADGVNLNVFDILNHPGRFKLNPMEAESDSKQDGFVARYFSRPTIIAMLNQYFGHLAWSYEIHGIEVGAHAAGYYGAVSATLTLWPNSYQPTHYTERGYGDGETAAQALYGAEVAALKRAFSRLGPTGGIQFWSDTFNLKEYTQKFTTALEQQRANPNAPKVINEDILLPPPPGWDIPVPQNHSEIDPSKSYSVDADAFLPQVSGPGTEAQPGIGQGQKYAASGNLGASLFGAR